MKEVQNEHFDCFSQEIDPFGGFLNKLCECFQQSINFKHNKNKMINHSNYRTWKSRTCSFLAWK